MLEDEGFRATPSEATRLKEIESLLIVEEGSALSVCSRDTQSTTLTAQVCFKLIRVFNNSENCICLVLLKPGRSRRVIDSQTESLIYPFYPRQM